LNVVANLTVCFSGETETKCVLSILIVGGALAEADGDGILPPFWLNWSALQSGETAHKWYDDESFANLGLSL